MKRRDVIINIDDSMNEYENLLERVLNVSNEVFEVKILINK
jgi:hypothetical protein